MRAEASITAIKAKLQRSATLIMAGKVDLQWPEKVVWNRGEKREEVGEVVADHVKCLEMVPVTW